MDKQTEEILQKIEEAEYVLVGLGQEFDMEFFLQSREDYRRIREQLQQQNVLWLLPYVEEHFRRQYLPEMEAEIEKGLQKLAKVLEKKSYFVVSSSMNHKMVLLEIGEGNRFPTIIRSPFERIALFQQKADLYCIDGEQNPIAWLLSLC